MTGSSSHPGGRGFSWSRAEPLVEVLSRLYTVVLLRSSSGFQRSHSPPAITAAAARPASIDEDARYAPAPVRIASWSPPCGLLRPAFADPRSAAAQETGTVTGTVTRSGEGSALPSVSVTVKGTGQSTITAPDGKYTLRRVPAGPQTIVFRWLGYRPTETPVDVAAGQHHHGGCGAGAGGGGADRAGGRGSVAGPGADRRGPGRDFSGPAGESSRAHPSRGRPPWPCRRCPGRMWSRAA